MTSQFINPIEQIRNPATGQPVVNAQIFFGKQDATDADTNPASRIRVFYVASDGSQVEMAQPVRTNGAGNPVSGAGVSAASIQVELATGEDAYSILARTAAGEQILYVSRVYAPVKQSDIGQFVKTVDLAASNSPVSIAGVTASSLMINATRRAINAQAFGLKPNDITFNNWAKAKELFDYCRTNKFDMYFPAGRWTVLELNWPFLNDEFPISSMLDCFNITLFGDGPATILETRSSNGADVLNLRALRNFHVRDLAVSATISGGASAGSNGVSLVYGWDNVTVMNVWAENLPYVEKPMFLDGGKAFTIQPGTTNLQVCGSLKANIYAKGCVHAVGYEIDLPSFVNQNPAIDIEFMAENCYEAVVISAGAPATTVPESLTTGFSCRGFSINSQKDVVAARAHGVNIDVQIVTSKTAAQRKLNPSGVQWKTGDDEVTAGIVLAAKNSNFWLKGDKRECTTKITVGAANAGSAGYFGDTKNCTLDIDVAGSGAVSDFTVEIFSGLSVSTCELVISKKTITAPPVELYKGANQNAVWSGTDLQLQLLKTRNLSFVGNTDPNFTYATLGLTNDVLTSRQFAASPPNAIIHDFKSNSGGSVLSVRNDGALNTSASIVASSVTTVSAVVPVYNETGVRIGYMPLYSTYS